MNIKLEIFGDSPAEVLAALRDLAAGVSPVAVGASLPASTGSGPGEAEAPKPRARKSNVVDLASAKRTEAAETKPDPEAETRADEPEAAAEQPAEETVAEPEPEAPKIELSVDLVRKYAVKYVNELAKASGATESTDVQSKAREAFNELLGHFGATKFTEIGDAKMADVHAWIVEQRATEGLDPLDIATLA